MDHTNDPATPASAHRAAKMMPIDDAASLSNKSTPKYQDEILEFLLNDPRVSAVIFVGDLDDGLKVRQ
jgi:hypothetical protein